MSVSKLYKMPLQFGRLMERNQDLPSCELKESVAQNISLIIGSKYNEHRFDQNYGCEIWDKDFELITNQLAWQEQANKSILKSITRYEPRLEHVDVETILTEFIHTHPQTHVRSIKKKIAINVRGKYRHTGDVFNVPYTLYLSPVSVD